MSDTLTLPRQSVPTAPFVHNITWTVSQEALRTVCCIDPEITAALFPVLATPSICVTFPDVIQFGGRERPSKDPSLSNSGPVCILPADSGGEVSTRKPSDTNGKDLWPAESTACT